MAKFGWKSFIGGILLGSAGFDLLRSKEADKVYVSVTEAVLIARDYVMENVEKINARTQDIYTDAKEKADRYLAQKKAQCTVEEFDRGVDL
jgi:hypothetical protein